MIKFRYVKRALPIDDEHPRERFETTRDLMVVLDFCDNNYNDEQFLSEVRDYFSIYGKIYACKYCNKQNFRYILVEFADKGKKKNNKRIESMANSLLKIQCIFSFRSC